MMMMIIQMLKLRRGTTKVISR